MVAKPLCPLYKYMIKPLDRAYYPELRYRLIYRFCPSWNVIEYSTTMASADFSRQALLHDFRKKTTNRHVRETSLVKYAVFPSYTHLIYCMQFRVVIGL